MYVHTTRIKNIFPGSHVARFNVAAWQEEEFKRTVLVGREVTERGQEGEPDIGKLVLFELDEQGEVVHERVIWEPLYESFYLEDPRAMVLADGRIVIGLTAVLRMKQGVEPFPAVVTVGQRWRDLLSAVTVIFTFGPGKNLTPFSDGLFLFRPDHKDWYHTLVLFDMKHEIPKSVQNFHLPTNLTWGEWRMGTTMPPLWQSPTEALLFIHGITIVDKKYVYSIGVAKITQTGEEYSIQVHPEALITPDTFLNEEGVPLVDELRPEERRVVYACGGVVKKDEPDDLHLYVNVGDRTTFDVVLSLPEIKKYFE